MRCIGQLCGVKASPLISYRPMEITASMRAIQRMTYLQNKMHDPVRASRTKSAAVRSATTGSASRASTRKKSASAGSRSRSAARAMSTDSDRVMSRRANHMKALNDATAFVNFKRAVQFKRTDGPWQTLIARLPVAYSQYHSYMIRVILEVLHFKQKRPMQVLIQLVESPAMHKLLLMQEGMLNQMFHMSGISMMEMSRLTMVAGHIVDVTQYIDMMPSDSRGPNRPFDPYKTPWQYVLGLHRDFDILDYRDPTFLTKRYMHFMKTVSAILRYDPRGYHDADIMRRAVDFLYAPETAKKRRGWFTRAKPDVVTNAMVCTAYAKDLSYALKETPGLTTSNAVTENVVKWVMRDIRRMVCITHTANGRSYVDLNALMGLMQQRYRKAVGDRPLRDYRSLVTVAGPAGLLYIAHVLLNVKWPPRNLNTIFVDEEPVSETFLLYHPKIALILKLFQKDRVKFARLYGTSWSKRSRASAV